MSEQAEIAMQVLERADCIYDKSQVGSALDRMAEEIKQKLSSTNPLVLCLMNGGLIPCSELLLRLDFALELDYIHASRYGNDTSGTELKWIAEARKPLKDRTVLIVDDILDEGETLAAIMQYCREQQATNVYSAVLVEKEHDRKTGMKKADFTGLSVPDRYVFGYGMDYKGYLRNIPAIYAAKKEDE